MYFIDIHNHTNWSDGEDTIEDIVVNAIKKNINVIGISDHFNTDKCKSVPLLKLNNYLSSINIIKEKYKDKIQVLAGIEICSLPYPKSLENLPIDIINKFDFILVEYLDLLSPKSELAYVEDFLSKIKCKKGLAHTDITKLSNKFNSLDEVGTFFKRNDLFWELNSSSWCDALYNITCEDKYNLDIINMIKKYNIEVIPGSDTHSLIDYEYGRLNKANNIARALNNYI